MDLSCLDNLVAIVNDQTVRDYTSLLYLNDLPTMSLDENAFKVGNIIKGDVVSGNNTISNLTFNSDNLNVDSYIKNRAFPLCTKITGKPDVNTITVDQVADETCCQIPMYIKDAGEVFLDQQLEFAKRIMVSDIMTYFSGCLRMNQVVNNDIVGKYQDFDSSTIQALGNQFRGIQVTIDKYPYLEFYLHKLRLFFNTAITDTIRVYDLIENRNLTPIAFTSVANQITDINVNTAYPTNKQRINLLFYYDASLTGYYESWISGQKNCSGCDFSPNGYSYFNGAEIAQGAITDSTLDKTGETYGMSLTYSLNCTFAPFLCSIRDLIQLPLLYKWGSLIANALARDPDKVNSIVTLNRDNHTELAQEYDQEYNVRMFGGFNDDGSKKIKQGLMDRIVLPQDICFSRKRHVSAKTVIP